MTMLKYDSFEITLLRKMVEERVLYVPQTPADFERLGRMIWDDVHLQISTTTLKRLWGYVKGGETVRLATLDVLSAFLGFPSWNHFQAHYTLTDVSGEWPEGAVITRSLPIGAKVEVRWLPNRRCIFRHLGDGLFRVQESEHSKLVVDDVFHCDSFIPKHPLYLDELTRGNKELGHYIAGKKGGITFTLC